MKKTIFTVIALLSALILFACISNEPGSVSQPDTSADGTEVSELSKAPSTASEAEEVSEAIEVSLPEESEPEPEVSEEESLPEIFNTETKSAEQIRVPHGYEEILSLIENKNYEQAYELLKQKEHDVYGETLLKRFTTFYEEFINNYVWDQSGVCWAVEKHTLDENGRLVKSKYSDDYSPNAAGSVFEYVYNENGMLVEDRHGNYFYDEQNRLTEIRWDSRREYLYWYDNGLLARHKVYYSYKGEDDTPDAVREYYYDTNGRKIREDCYGQSGLLTTVTQWTHNLKGKINTVKVTYRSGKVSESTYQYDMLTDRLTKITTIDSDGNTVIEEYTYPNGKLSVHKKYDPNHYYTYFRYQYTYDSDGNIETMTYINREHLEIDYATSIYETDKKGNIIRTETYGYNDHSGYVHDIVTRGYDSDGNLAWQNSGDPQTDWAWSQRTFYGYTVYYNEYAEFLNLPTLQ